MKFPTITAVLARLLPRSEPPPQQLEYWREADLAAPADELLEAGIVELWRVDSTGERWYRSQPGAVEWFSSIRGDDDE